MGIPLSELEQTMDYSEFIELSYFLELEMQQHTKNDYYLAQIAGLLAGGKNKKISDFLIKFGEPKKKPIKIKAKDQVNIFKKILGIK